MNRVIKVKFRSGARFYYFDALDFEINDGDGVIVETARGNMLGTAIGVPEETSEENLVAPLKPVLRLATEDDLRQQEYYQSKEAEAGEICQKRIDEHGLAMKLVDVEYAYNGTKLTFYFTADSRVDFRELLKDLTSTFKTRIDLRQIGERDEAKKCGGLGFCGRPICCNTFLNEFTPVSIRMAKTQNLSLNPIKISGICGKLMCCLRYEQDAYESMQKIMPKPGKEFRTPDGVGTVLENNIITETTKVKVTLADGTLDVRSYPFRELESVNPPASNTSVSVETAGEQPAEAQDDGADVPSDPPIEAGDVAVDPAAEARTEPKLVPDKQNERGRNNFRGQEKRDPQKPNPKGGEPKFRPKYRNNRPNNNRNRNRNRSEGNGGGAE